MTMPWFRNRLAATATLTLFAFVASSPALRAQTPPPELPSGWVDKTIVYTDYDMVAAANPLAVKAGADTLAAGGSAVDAAITVQMVLNLVEPQSSGIGGGAFMVTFDARSNKVETWDGRETAPMAADGNLFMTPTGPMGFTAAVIGGRSVGTPGALRLLELAHKDKGRLPWAKLFEPAIALCEQGFALSPRLFAALSGANAALKTDPVTGPYFYQADGTPKPVGTIIRNPELAATFRAIAAGGADAFYSGDIANDIVAKVRSHPTNPGLLAAGDLAAYKAKKREPVCGQYRGRTICGMSMPSSGPTTVLMTLAMLEGFDLRAMGPYTADSVHVISEAYRLAYADRGQYMADADFVSVPLAGLLDRNYLAQRAKLINMTKSIGVPPVGQPPGCCAAVVGEGLHHEPEGTSHMSIVDREGNAVSMTTTIESGFGSYQMVRGFLLNNQLTDFSFTPTTTTGAPVANRVEPGKRPRSSMAPVLVFDGKMRLEAIVGSPGGSAIIQYVTKTLIGLYDWNLDIQQAINHGNFGAQTTATTQLERGSSVKDLGPALSARGHTVSVVDINSGLHGITFNGMRDDGNRSGLAAIVLPYAGWAGGADPRREGTAAGF
jgi:gamma-glutamyltranspeptidase/glutathione hydrolase